MSKKIAELQEKVTKAEANVEKIKGTIAKHEAAVAKKMAVLAKSGVTAENMAEMKWNKDEGRGSEFYWPICEVESKLGDVKSANRKLRDAEQIVENHKARLAAEVEKERFLNNDAPEVIKEFLEQWKASVYEYCVESFPKYKQEKKTYEDAIEKGKAEYVKADPTRRTTWGSACKEFVKEYLKENKIYATYTAYPPLVRTMDTYYNESERLAWLEKTLEADKKAKMIDLVHRINGVVGTITDASNLRIGEKGTLDGIINGEKGNAKIQTVGAGGEYIQCFHFRTLVHEIK